MSNDEYEVGYGKPPKATQWVKGGPSPNPKGRPKKMKAERSLTQRQLRRDILSVTEELIPVRVGDKTHLMPFPVALMLAIRAKALSGHAPSQRFIAKVHAEAVKLHEDAHLAFQVLEKKEAELTLNHPLLLGSDAIDVLRKTTRQV